MTAKTQSGLTGRQALAEDVLAARNALNKALTAAAGAGLAVDVRLVTCAQVGAARAGVASYLLVEALPASDDISSDRSFGVAASKNDSVQHWK